MAKLFGRGFSVMDERIKEKEMMQESRKGKLYRFFFGKNDNEAEISFLTEEPICFQEHNIKSGETYMSVTCVGEGCPYCKESKARDVFAWLVVDHRSYEAKVYDENNVDTGKKKTVKDRIKLLVRGMTDAASLKRLSEKYGLTDRPYTVTKTGTGKNTKWDFDRGEPREMTSKRISEYREQLPEKLRSLDFYKIVEMQISPESSEETVSKEEAREEASKGVQRVEETKTSGAKRFLKK